MLDKLRDGITLHAEKKAQIAIRVIEDQMMSLGPRHRLAVLGMREVIKTSLQEMKDQLAGLPPPMERNLFDGEFYPKASYNNGYQDFTDQQRDLKSRIPDVDHAVSDFYAILDVQKFCESARTLDDLVAKVGSDLALDSGHTRNPRVGAALTNIAEISAANTPEGISSALEKHEPGLAQIAEQEAKHAAFMQHLRENATPSW